MYSLERSLDQAGGDILWGEAGRAISNAKVWGDLLCSIRPRFRVGERKKGKRKEEKTR